jgi:hypothetical protein
MEARPTLHMASMSRMIVELTNYISNLEQKLVKIPEPEHTLSRAGWPTEVRQVPDGEQLRTHVYRGSKEVNLWTSIRGRWCFERTKLLFL